MTYRPDIDGLRALAVLAVIANHLPGMWLSSGFLGVDVFFVISGFVVTASLVNREAAGFKNFYADFLARRIRRLWPALIVCVALTSIAVLTFDPFPVASIDTGIAALFGLSNIVLFSAELDYFAASSKFNAFTHTWSLGVEEQFYIVFPIIFWLSMNRAKNSLVRLQLTLIAVSFLSISFFIFYYPRNLPAAYFLMPMRIWELGVGSIAFLLSQRLRGEQSYQRAILAVCSFVAVVACFLAPQEQALVTTVLVVAATSLLLIFQVGHPFQRMFSVAPLVYVGRISYSLYLYHWPVISLAPLVLPDAWRITGLYVVAMLFLSVFSYHAIEPPPSSAKLE